MSDYFVYLDVERFKVIKILLLDFVGLSCCEFFYGQTCSKCGSSKAVTSTKNGVMKCLGYNNRHMDSRLGGFDVEMLRMCMFGQGWDLQKNFNIELC